MENERKIKTFEDLEVYKIAREFGRNIENIIKKLPSDEKYRLVSQMRRAKLSITNNIAEGYGRFHFQENIQFCRQARGSIYELIDDFIECFEYAYINEDELLQLKTDGYKVIKILNAYISSTKKLKNDFRSET